MDVSQKLNESEEKQKRQKSELDRTINERNELELDILQLQDHCKASQLQLETFQQASEDWHHLLLQKTKTLEDLSMATAANAEKHLRTTSPNPDQIQKIRQLEKMNEDLLDMIEDANMKLSKLSTMENEYQEEKSKRVDAEAELDVYKVQIEAFRKQAVLNNESSISDRITQMQKTIIKLESENSKLRNEYELLKMSTARDSVASMDRSKEKTTLDIGSFEKAGQSNFEPLNRADQGNFALESTELNQNLLIHEKLENNKRWNLKWELGKCQNELMSLREHYERLDLNFQKLEIEKKAADKKVELSLKDIRDLSIQLEVANQDRYKHELTIQGLHAQLEQKEANLRQTHLDLKILSQKKNSLTKLTESCRRTEDDTKADAGVAKSGRMDLEASPYLVSQDEVNNIYVDQLCKNQSRTQRV